MKNLIVNADDLCLTEGVDRAILELLAANLISSASAMVTSHERRSRLAKYNMKFLAGRVGLHLQLSGGEPLSLPKDIPSLVNPDTGIFFKSQQPPNPSSHEVDIEWRRQIQAFHDCTGFLPSHLDTHQGAHRVASCEPVYLSLAASFKLPVRGYDDAYAQRIKNHGLIGSDYVLRGWTGKNLGIAKLRNAILEAFANRNRSTVELVTHPGYCDEELIQISRLSSARETDLSAVRELTADDWLSSHDISLINRLGKPLIRTLSSNG